MSLVLRTSIFARRSLVTTAVPQPNLTKSMYSAAGRHQVGEIPQRNAAVDHHRESGVARLFGPARQVQGGLIHLLSLSDGLVT